MSALTNLSDDELRAELARREKERADAATLVRSERFTTLVRNRDVLLELVPHGRTSCSDSNPINGLDSSEHGPRCTRCALLELGVGDAFLYEFELSLNFVPLNR